jgi:CubicO group peptidase (beta-lactamase class C family)
MSERTITTQDTALLNEKVDALFAEWDKPHTPGCAIAIIQNGEIIYSRGYGMANLEYDVPISINSVFDIGSTSKQFVALSIAILARQGKLSLDDEIQTYLPELRSYEKPISIYQLIHHTSGLRDYPTLMYLAGLPFEHNYPEKTILNIIARQKHLNFQPGEKFLYSNTGYLLLAEIAKRVSGCSLRAFANEHIFEPLGMKDTHFHDDFSDVVKNRAVGYSPVPGGSFRVDTSLFDLVGDGGLYTTVSDLSIWDANAYRNKIGGYKQSLITEITTPGHLNNGTKLDYAYGLFARPYQGLKMVYHTGIWMGYKAVLARFPDQRFSVICLSNLSSIDPLHLVKQISDLYLVDEFTENKREIEARPRSVSSIPQFNLESKAGFYRSINDDEIWELSIQHGKLIVEYFGTTFELAPIEQERFTAVGVPVDMFITFDLQRPQNLYVIHVLQANGETDTLGSIQLDTSDSKQHCDYSGDYYCEELDVCYTIDLEDDKLLLNRDYLPQDMLTVISPDICKGMGAYFSFTRTTQDQVTGFKLDTARVKNLYFSKR